MSGPVRALVFGSLRERVGQPEVLIDGPVITVADVWAALVRAHPRAESERGALRCARNLEYCDWQTAVASGDEVAFLPPVCGGACTGDDRAVHVRLSGDPIVVDQLLARAGGSADGAVACFVGRVRDHNEGAAVVRLDYQAYAPMAEALMHRIAAAARERHQLSSIAVVHRVGELSVGEAAVVVVTASPHRAAALDACREVIDAVKADVPIWKREHTAAGARWLDARHAATHA